MSQWITIKKGTTAVNLAQVVTVKTKTDAGGKRSIKFFLADGKFEECDDADEVKAVAKELRKLKIEVSA